MGFFLAALVVSKVIQGIAGAKAAGDKQDARNALGNITKIDNRRRKAQFLRDSRIMQANALSTGAGTLGGLDSSRSQGQVASTASQTGFGLTELANKERFADTANRNLASAANAERIGNIAGAVGSISQNVLTFTK